MTTALQRKLLSLLDEFGELCNREGICWSLSGATACDALEAGRFSKSSYEVFVDIPEKQIPRLKTLVKESATENRELFSFKEADASEYLKTCLYYSATDTTLFDFRRDNSSVPPYLSVTIQPVRLEPKTQCYVALLPDSQKLKLPRDYFEEIDQVELEGKKYPLSTKFIKSYAEVISTTKNRVTWPYALLMSSAIEVYGSTSESYGQFLSRLEKVGCRELVNEIHGHYINRMHWMAEDLYPAKEIVEQDNIAMELTELRYKFWLKYYPFKNKILERFEGGYEEAVARAFNPYTKSLVDYYEHTGKAICFDKDLFMLALKILQTNGYERTEELEAAVPKGHEKPLLSPIRHRRLIKKIVASTTNLPATQASAMGGIIESNHV